ncbi:hypothetical protein ZWY2020_005637 [Hordeum vulgare]|nr:hypothetical protein ZWY2020_005637 [Hordeum vulgare]
MHKSIKSFTLAIIDATCASKMSFGHEPKVNSSRCHTFCLKHRWLRPPPPSLLVKEALLEKRLLEKKTVLDIHNNPNVGYRRGITEFANGKLRKPCSSDLLDLKIAKEIDHLVQAIVDDSGKLYKRVFANYKPVQDRLYVHLPKGGDVKTITSNPYWAH